ncbi:MAG: right-handed parallel beta-helix repeat-containing protein, partial [Deltaproteobacteria bacterium]|nr:right-handed parallel beta-helix repeat-containing protein [Deltaproteobacteria bacterium]
SRWTCDGIMLYDAEEVETKHNKIYDNDYGIAIQKYVNYAKLEHDDIKNNGWGIYTYNWIASTILVKHAKIKENEYGWINWDTDGITFEKCHIEKNEVGFYASAWSTTNPTAVFSDCKIVKNTVMDVEHDSNTLIFTKVKYDTYLNNGGGVLIED